MKILIISLVTFFIALNGFSKEVVVEMLNKRDDGEKMVFSEDVVKVDVGDTPVAKILQDASIKK